MDYYTLPDAGVPRGRVVVVVVGDGGRYSSSEPVSHSGKRAIKASVAASLAGVPYR